MKALISGTFDPITVGHLDVIRRAATMFDEVYAVVFNNTEKSCRFDLNTRCAMVKAACEGLDHVTVDVCDGLLAAYTEAHDIGVIVRGVRDASDVPYEMSLSTINRGLRNHPDTVFIPAKPEYFHISSSYVRNMLKYGESLVGIVPERALAVLDAAGLL
ncbi:MAG: pantetheine-phosphate adenylyltransferase [Ruminococcaceae bacterium]|nr:pantetheine-phosphate adenylyltransferase [Oscillospiraceae bacterium]